MKRWTVMLIPHDRGETRTLNLSARPFWAALSVLAVLVFLVAFSFQRSQAIALEYQRLVEVTDHVLETQDAIPAPAAAPAAQDSGLSEEQKREIEERLRREYDASIEVLTAELLGFHALETKVRVIGGLPPRAEDTEALAEDVGDGRGGPAAGLGAFVQLQADLDMRPPTLIYGLSRPPADLLLQEIHLRAASLKAYIRDGEMQVDRLARVPSLRPVASHLGRLSSRFGRRIDPINRRLAPHNGIDIAASKGTPVFAAARGVVISSQRESQLGNIVRIDHGNGIETWYAHLHVREVSKGDTVERGGRIGQVGTTGRVTGPHLHYEVHVNGTPVDGRKYISD